MQPTNSDDPILRRLDGIFAQALNPRHWSRWNHQYPEKVRDWFAAVRYGKNPHRESPWFPDNNQLRRTRWDSPASEYWVWAPWRPLHDYVQFTSEELERWVQTTMRPNLFYDELDKLMSQDNPDITLDIVEKVWMAVTRMAWEEGISLHVYQETYRPFLWVSKLAFPIWTEIFPHELNWRPTWCQGCGLPIIDNELMLVKSCWTCVATQQAQERHRYLNKVAKTDYKTSTGTGVGIYGLLATAYSAKENQVVA